MELEGHTRHNWWYGAKKDIKTFGLSQENA